MPLSAILYASSDAPEAVLRGRDEASRAAASKDEKLTVADLHNIKVVSEWGERCLPSLRREIEAGAKKLGLAVAPEIGWSYYGGHEGRITITASARAE